VRYASVKKNALPVFLADTLQRVVDARLHFDHARYAARRSKRSFAYTFETDRYDFYWIKI
jgi:hypothetical protein